MATERNQEQVETSSAQLGFSRAYSLSLSPQLIYTRSNLLPALVSSKVYRQLEFLAVGSWWIYEHQVPREDVKNEGTERSEATPPTGALRRIPGGREDVFADKSIDLRSTRSLMKFLKLATDTEAQDSILEAWGSKTLPEFLESHLGIPSRLQAPLLALTMSPHPPEKTLTSYALARIHRHLTSVGMFGPGFGSVIPKWGGLAEIAQVACRAGAVGGGVYVLNKGFDANENIDQPALRSDQTRSFGISRPSTVRLEGGEDVKTDWIVGSTSSLPSQFKADMVEHATPVYVSRSIAIISSPLSQLFPPAEGAPPPAGAVVVFPTGSLALESEHNGNPTSTEDLPPVYLMVHSSDTGECPNGQCKCTLVFSFENFPCMMTKTYEYLSTLPATLLKISYL